MICDYGCTTSGLTPHATLWKEPLCRLGWTLAAYLRRQGVKGIGRHTLAKQDYSAAFKLLEQRKAEYGDQ